MEERRRFTRLDFESNVHIVHQAATVTGHLKNISLSGLFLETTDRQAIPIGDVVKVQILLPSPNDEPQIFLDLDGTIVRTEGGDETGVAVEFSLRHATLESLVILKTVVALCGDKQDQIVQEFWNLIEQIEAQLWE